MLRTKIMAWATVLAAALLVQSTPARAAVVYDSGGFESPRFHLLPSPILDSSQDPHSPSWNWGPSLGNIAGATAQIATFTGGSQGVAVTVQNVASSGYGYWWPDVPITPTPTANRVVVDWSMYVRTDAPGYLIAGQPFFGIDAYDATGNSISAVGIDASNGALSVVDPSGVTEYPALFTDALNAWHNYELVMNFTTQKAEIFVDGVQRGGDFSFVSTVSNFHDADLTTYAMSSSSINGLAYFDNYVISSVPEPVTGMAMLALASMAVLARRRIA
jgi:hypothetical protein